MKISRFFGANSRDVMRQVRQVLGPDALIVSNRSVDGGIEVLATMDGAFDDEPAQTPPRAASAAAQQAQERQPAASPYAAPGDRAQPAPQVMPQGGYAAPSRSIAAYQSAYAASAQPEPESGQDAAGFDGRPFESLA
ncbi:flagellar biosynthesis protein FlhF, partial [Achromobacter spanius]